MPVSLLLPEIYSFESCQSFKNDTTKNVNLRVLQQQEQEKWKQGKRPMQGTNDNMNLK